MRGNWLLNTAGLHCCHSQRQGRHHSQGQSLLTAVLQWAVRVVAAVQHCVAVELDALARQVLPREEGQVGRQRGPAEAAEAVSSQSYQRS